MQERTIEGEEKIKKEATKRAKNLTKILAKDKLKLDKIFGGIRWKRK